MGGFTKVLLSWSTSRPLPSGLSTKSNITHGGPRLNTGEFIPHEGDPLLGGSTPEIANSLSEHCSYSRLYINDLCSQPKAGSSRDGPHTTEAPHLQKTQPPLDLIVGPSRILKRWAFFYGRGMPAPPFDQRSACLLQVSAGPYVVQSWSRSPKKNEAPRPSKSTVWIGPVEVARV